MNPNDDSFEQLMRSAGFNDSRTDMDSLMEAGVIGPDNADDHTALHLVEALAQVSAFLDAEGYVAGYADSEGVADVRRILSIGTSQFFSEVHEMVGRIELGSPMDMEFMAFIRRAGGVMAQALDNYMLVREIDRFTCFTYLSGHGFFPFQIIRRGASPVDDSWKTEE